MWKRHYKPLVDSMNTTPKAYNPLRNDKGETLFYTLVGLPLLFGFCMLTLDLSSWQSLRQYTQKEVERIALGAAQFLPDEELVKQYVKDEVNGLTKLSDKSLEINLNVNSSSVDLALSANSPSFFDIFLKHKTKSETILGIKESASAALLPTDYVLILSDAASMRPAVYTAWGEKRDWPESSYFKFASAPVLSSDNQKQAPLHWPNWWKEDFETETFKRWATQQCFNPYFSSLKFAAMSLTDRFISEGENRFSLLFTPGDLANGPGFSIVRGLEFSNAEAAHYWSNYFDASSATSDEACAYYSSKSTAKDGEYEIPKSLSYVSSGTTKMCEHLFKTTPFEDGFAHLPDPALNRLDSCFTSGGASIQELIYYRAARSHYHDSDAENILASIEYALFSFANDSEAENNILEEVRKNLAAKAKKEIIVIADDLPLPDNPRLLKILEQISTLSAVKLSYIAFSHGGLSQEKQDTLFKSYQDLQKGNHINFEIYFAENSRDLGSLVSLFQKRAKQIAVKT